MVFHEGRYWCRTLEWVVGGGGKGDPLRVTFYLRVGVVGLEGWKSSGELGLGVWGGKRDGGKNRNEGGMGWTSGSR